MRPDATAADGRNFGYNAMLKTDGTFDVQLPPGRYDVTLSVLGPDGAVRKKVLVEAGVLILEGQPKEVIRP